MYIVDAITIKIYNFEHDIVDYPQLFSHFFFFLFHMKSYASILYLRVPPSFRIILRGKDVQHHNIVNDMMMSQEVTYRPQPNADGIPKDDVIPFMN